MADSVRDVLLSSETVVERNAVENGVESIEELIRFHLFEFIDHPWLAFWWKVESRETDANRN